MSSQLLKDRFQALELVEIADNHLKLGQIEQAQENFARAFQIAQTFPNDIPKVLPQCSVSVREQVLNAFIRSYAQVENYGSAVRVARGIEDEDFQACALSAIASQVAALGQPDSALSIAQTIEINYYKAMALIDIYYSYSQAEQTNKAAEILTQIIRIAGVIKNDREPAWMLTHLSYYVQENLGQLDTAFEIAQLVENDRDKALVLNLLAQKYAQSGKFKQAIQIAEIIIDNEEKELALARVAVEYAKFGQSDEALKIVAIVDNWKNIPLIQVIKNYAEAGEFERAKQLTETIEHSENNDDRYEAFNAITDGYVKAGQFEQAIQFAGSLDDNFNKSEALSVIAYRCAEFGQFDRAFKVIQTIYEINDGSVCDIFLECIFDFVAKAEERERVLKIIQTIENESYRNFMLGWSAGDYADAGQFDRSIKITKMMTDESYSSYALSWEVESAIASKQYDRAVEVAQTIHDMNFLQSIRLGENVIAVAEAGQIDQAFKIARTINDKHEKAQALANVALSYAESAQQEKASEVFAEAVEIAHCLENIYLKIGSLEAIATNLSRAGQLSKAMEMLSGALQIVSTVEDEFHKLSLQRELNSKMRKLTKSA
ncbi:tetratricopeptide repeat protein [Microcoleus sp. B4-D4]|uniref:tetratricopeptide repeat protein n=1 Tax=Microcoleus sp. B4-D4 TaxID=2818667 RepID=UPI002FD07BD9